MPKIQKKQINHLADLARLALTNQEKNLFTRQLSAILDHVSQLKKVDVQGVEPISQVTGLDNVLRNDEDQIGLETLDRIEALKNAVNREKGYVKTRSIFG